MIHKNHRADRRYDVRSRAGHTALAVSDQDTDSGTSTAGLQSRCGRQEGSRLASRSLCKARSSALFICCPRSARDARRAGRTLSARSVRPRKNRGWQLYKARAASVCLLPRRHRHRHHLQDRHHRVQPDRRPRRCLHHMDWLRCHLLDHRRRHHPPAQCQPSSCVSRRHRSEHPSLSQIWWCRGWCLRLRPRTSRLGARRPATRLPPQW